MLYSFFWVASCLDILILLIAAKGHSIFVGNLPDSATVDQLKLIFEQFGPVKLDGIQVRSQKVSLNSPSCSSIF